MSSAQEQTLFQVKDSHESAMHVNEGTVSRRLGATSKTCLYFIIATLGVLLIFALATIMVLVVQRMGAERPPVQKQHSHSPSVAGLEFPDQGTSVDSVTQVPQETPGLAPKTLQLMVTLCCQLDYVSDNFMTETCIFLCPKECMSLGQCRPCDPCLGYHCIKRRLLVASRSQSPLAPLQAADPATEGIAKPIRTGNTSEDYLSILQNVPTKGAAAYMRVSNPVNSSKLSLVEKGICEHIQCKSEELVIQKQGLYLIYCHLNFHFPNCLNGPTDLKIELLVNDKVNRQTLSTWCASGTSQEKTFKTLFQLHLTNLNVKDRISITLNHPKFLNEISLPNDNVLGVLCYSDEM